MTPWAERLPEVNEAVSHLRRSRAEKEQRDEATTGRLLLIKTLVSSGSALGVCECVCTCVHVLLMLWPFDLLLRAESDSLLGLKLG